MEEGGTISSADGKTRSAKKGMLSSKILMSPRPMDELHAHNNGITSAQEVRGRNSLNYKSSF